MVSRLQRLSYPACDPIDTRDFQGAWLQLHTLEDRGDGQLTVAGRITSNVFCAAATGPRNFLERDVSTCEPCDCDSFAECVPAGCRSACGTSRTCSSGLTCNADGRCVACGFLNGEVQCGGGPDGCGSCPGGTMCVEGLCSTAVRCSVAPGPLCDVPDWCPVDVRNIVGPYGEGTPCTCVFPSLGGSCAVFSGSMEFL